MSVIQSTAIQSKTRAFAKNEDGAVAIIFSLASMAIFMTTGLAIDVGRVMHAERTMTNALDAAALAAAKGMKVSGLNDGEVQAVAQRYFDINMAGHGGSYANIQSFTVIVNRNNNSVAIDVHLFLGLAGCAGVLGDQHELRRHIGQPLSSHRRGAQAQQLGGLAVGGRDAALGIQADDAGRHLGQHRLDELAVLVSLIAGALEGRLLCLKIMCHAVEGAG